jgi:hypothetical protein
MLRTRPKVGDWILWKQGTKWQDVGQVFKVEHNKAYCIWTIDGISLYFDLTADQENWKILSIEEAIIARMTGELEWKKVIWATSENGTTSTVRVPKSVTGYRGSVEHNGKTWDRYSK